MPTPPPPAAVATPSAFPILLLRAEGLVLLIAAAAGYRWLHLTEASAWGWLTFALLFFVPDVAMLGYLRSPRVGATLYNVAHTETLYAMIAAAGWSSESAPLVSLGLIGLAHVGFDRLFGYGLKYPTAFNDTHLGRIGRGPAGAS